MQLFLVDKATGRRRNAAMFLPYAILASASVENGKFLLHQITDMEAAYAEFETQGLNFTEMVTVEPIKRGMDFIGYSQKVKAGQAQFLSRSATDWPKANTGSQTYLSPVIPLGISYSMNFFEKEKGELFGLNIDTDQAQDCAEYNDQKLDETFHMGGKNPDGLQVKGVFDYFNGGADTQIKAGTTIHKTTLSTGTGGTSWADKDGIEIYNDVESAITDVFINSRKMKRAKKVAWGFNALKAMKDKTIRLDNGSIYKTMDYIKNAYPEISFIVDPYLDEIKFKNTNENFTGGEGDNVMFVYDDAVTNIKFRANTREVLTPYEHKGFVTEVKTFALTGGVQVKNTYFGTYMKGI